MTYAPRDTSNSTWTIDLRSDTVTQPDASMRAAMAEAEVGDDVYGEDATVNRLEAVAAERLGMEAALFVPSGTMSNLCAMLAHCGRGEEVLTGARYHTYYWEARGASVLGGVALTPIAVAPDGGLDPDAIEAEVKADDSHWPITRLLSLENTHDGRAVSLDRTAAAVAVARDAGLSAHLDGARFFNAITALGITPVELAGLFDTVSICLSKGLGTPVGSVLVGSADLIERARRLRKMLGGGMRQAGVLAAAGLHALDHNVGRLADDHARAADFADQIERRGLGRATVATNMVWMELEPTAGMKIAARAADERIAIRTEGRARAVFHRDIDDTAFRRLVDLLNV